ncbi:MAG: hypothetical protein ACT6S0_04635 [Roseateles sp.]
MSKEELKRVIDAFFTNDKRPIHETLRDLQEVLDYAEALVESTRSEIE